MHSAVAPLQLFVEEPIASARVESEVDVHSVIARLERPYEVAAVRRNCIPLQAACFVVAAPSECLATEEDGSEKVILHTMLPWVS